LPASAHATGEWPLVVFTAVWATLVVAGWLASLFNALNSLPVYATATFAGLTLILWLQRSVYGAPPGTLSAPPVVLPVFYQHCFAAVPEMAKVFSGWYAGACGDYRSYHGPELLSR